MSEHKKRLVLKGSVEDLVEMAAENNMSLNISFYPQKKIDIDFENEIDIDMEDLERREKAEDGN